MRGDNKLTIFASGNGDTIMLEAYNQTIVTDIHYRRDQAEDPEKDHVPDFAPDIRAACPDDHLNVFVLTHPDKDHLGGWSEIFHCGGPDEHDSDPEEGEPKIIVDEIWCSPYSANPHYETDQATPLLAEIRRRKALQGTDRGTIKGNRLNIMDTSTHTAGEVTNQLSWRLLAPTPEEVDVPKAAKGESPTSSNQTSLVIRWTVIIGGYENKILLGGDSTVDVWERIDQEVHAEEPEHLAWHILVAPHHCSRHSIGRVNNGNGNDAEFDESEGALRALGEQLGSGFVVSSSKRIIRGQQTPPSFHAKNRYLKILSRGGEVSDGIRNRFLCTGGDANEDAPAHIVFNLTRMGPTRSQKSKGAEAAAVAASSVGRGGGYGQW